MANEFVYAGLPIGKRDDQLCLTDMWRANGSDKSKRPVEWLRSTAAEQFIECLTVILEVGNSHLVTTETGGREIGGAGGGATWAHWQIGFAYAKYLSPEFHVWCNNVVRAHMQQRYAVGIGAQIELKLIEELERRVDHHEVRLDQHEHVLLDTHRLMRETHENVITVKQWQEKARLPQPRRFSDEDERICYLVLHLEFGGKCPIDRITVLTDENGKRLPDLSDLDHWHGPQYNSIENALPVSLAVHKKLTSDPDYRAANAPTFQHFHLMRVKLKEQCAFVRPKPPKKSRRKGTDSHSDQTDMGW